MGPLSTLIVTLAACSVHIGVLPVEGAWSIGAVSAPVAEPEVDGWVRDGLVDALAARRALASGGPVLSAVVTEASWTPARRGGDVLLYEARLTVRVEGGGKVVTRTRTGSVVDPGSAGEGRALREKMFRGLARQVADDAVTWLLTPG
jgi:hypothetical protein